MQTSAVAPRDRLIVGLDLPSVEAAEAMIAQLGDSVTFYKIGYQLAYAGGLALVPSLLRAQKAAELRKIVGLKLRLVTPGIRPAAGAAGDQKRVMTPARAIAAGADYLVVARPVIEAPDPKLAADGIVAEIAVAIG